MPTCLSRACLSCQAHAPSRAEIAVEHKLGLAVMQVHTTGRPAHYPDRLLGTKQAAWPGGVQLTDAAGRPKGNQKVLIFLQRKQHHHHHHHYYYYYSYHYHYFCLLLSVFIRFPLHGALPPCVVRLSCMSW